MTSAATLEQTALIERTKEHVRAKLEGEGTGHDWWHIVRVHRMAVRLTELEGDADPLVVELGALLHDIADWKFHGGDLTAGPRAAREWLASIGTDEDVIRRVCQVMEDVSFKGAGVRTKPRSKEGEIVQDADRLDALGAIGIGRAFAYGGHANRLMYHPDAGPEMHQTFEAYRNSQGTTINHFHEKLFLLRDRLHTAAAKRIADSRHQYMEDFVERFLAEWEGRDNMEA